MSDAKQTTPARLPIRVQRKRTKGWRMPKDTVSVCRPGKWGNPFRVEDFRYRTVEIDPDYSTATGRVRQSDQEARREAVWAFEGWVQTQPEFVAAARRELRGKNLACFCPLNQPCHADLLLRLANSRVDAPRPTDGSEGGAR